MADRVTMQQIRAKNRRVLKKNLTEAGKAVVDPVRAVGKAAGDAVEDVVGAVQSEISEARKQGEAINRMLKAAMQRRKAKR